MTHEGKYTLLNRKVQYVNNRKYRLEFGRFSDFGLAQKKTPCYSMDC